MMQRTGTVKRETKASDGQGGWRTVEPLEVAAGVRCAYSSSSRIEEVVGGQQRNAETANLYVPNATDIARGDLFTVDEVLIRGVRFPEVTLRVLAVEHPSAAGHVAGGQIRCPVEEIQHGAVVHTVEPS